MACVAMAMSATFTAALIFTAVIIMATIAMCYPAATLIITTIIHCVISDSCGKAMTPMTTVLVPTMTRMVIILVVAMTVTCHRRQSLDD